jgi:hypothetical protein
LFLVQIVIIDRRFYKSASYALQITREQFHRHKRRKVLSVCGRNSECFGFNEAKARVVGWMAEKQYRPVTHLLCAFDGMSHQRAAHSSFLIRRKYAQGAEIQHILFLVIRLQDVRLAVDHVPDNLPVRFRHKIQFQDAVLLAQRMYHIVLGAADAEFGDPFRPPERLPGKLLHDAIILWFFRPDDDFHRSIWIDRNLAHSGPPFG